MKRLVVIFIFFIGSTSMTCNFVQAPDDILQYLVREPLIKTLNPPLLLLLHGYGSNEKDLFALSKQFPDEFLIISARAPYTIGFNSYAWFDITFSGGKPVSINKEQAEKSRITLVQFIDQLKNKFTFDTSLVYLSGFSQGGIMSYCVGLTKPDKIKGIAVMSGRLPDEVKPLISQSEKLKQLEIFVSHGINDNVIGVQSARESVDWLRKKGLNPVYKEYPAGHSITPEMILDLQLWFKDKE
jgi:phospholipase/carboxylesterase